ncbi:MAG: FAD-binding oxidoreductase [Verrucomicrobiota bacterium]|nr:FAD-binding oxidoreductase [Verrucomicrobiota bacterium]
MVGAGLAGCLLAWNLLKRGTPFILIGSRSLPCAYKVAAGLINPVTGRWMTKSWNFDQLLPEAELMYRSIEIALGIKIYHPLPVLRFCQNKEDVKRVRRRLNNPRYQDVLGKYHEPGSATSQFNDKHGCFEIKQAAYVDLPKLVNSLQEVFLQEDQYRDEYFDHSQLKRASSNWKYHDIIAEVVVFCEGTALVKNPWFDHVPLTPIKGETLHCKTTTLELDTRLIHYKKWILPYSDGSFRIGATYDESDHNPAPTACGKEALLAAALEALNKSHSIETISHQAGIRPATSDSRPIVGAHPKYPGLYLLNGLGSKGATSCPSMAMQLTKHITYGMPLDSHVDVKRFKARTI